MVEFLADAYPQKGLAPPPGASMARADYLQMLHFGSTWMDMMLWQVRAHEHMLPTTERDARTVARYRKKLATEVEPQLAARLEASPDICGETFTAADCVVAHSVVWARGYGMCRSEVFKRYLSLLQTARVYQRLRRHGRVLDRSADWQTADGAVHRLTQGNSACSKSVGCCLSSPRSC